MRKKSVECPDQIHEVAWEQEIDVMMAESRRGSRQAREAGYGAGREEGTSAKLTTRYHVLNSALPGTLYLPITRIHVPYATLFPEGPIASELADENGLSEKRYLTSNSWLKRSWPQPLLF